MSITLVIQVVSFDSDSDSESPAGSLLYVTKEFRLSDSPSILGAIVSASLLGTASLATFTWALPLANSLR